MVDLAMSSKGQAAGAAVLIAIIAGVLIMFIILIPPADRAELLGEQDSSSSGKSSGSSGKAGVIKNFILQSPGRIDYLTQKEIEHPLPVINVYTSEESKIISEKSVVSAKRGILSKKPSEFTFQVDGLDDIKSPLLSFTTKTLQGHLIITLNGEEVYSGDPSSSFRPITLPRDLLRSENVLLFSVSSPGLAFWRTNEFVAEQVRVVADVTNRESQVANHVFLVSETEKNNLDRVTLKFQPECRYGEAGPLSIRLNGKEIYNALADCDVALIPLELAAGDVRQGENSISFSTNRGTYVLTHVTVVSKLQEVDFPTYYFELSQEEYEEVNDGPRRLRVALSFVDVTKTREGQVIFNGNSYHFDTRNATISFDVSDDAIRGTNSVKITPRKTLEVRELRVDMVR